MLHRDALELLEWKSTCRASMCFIVCNKMDERKEEKDKINI